MGETVHWELTVLEDADSKDVLRVVTYSGQPPVLEKRHLFLDQRRKQWRIGKVRGLTGLDFARCVEMMDEFKEELLRPWRTPRAQNGEGP